MPGKRKPMLKSSGGWPSPKPCCFVVTAPAWFAVGTKQHVNDREDSRLPTHGLIHVIPIYSKISCLQEASRHECTQQPDYIYSDWKLKMNDEYTCIVYCYYILLYVATLNFCAPWYVTPLKSRTGMPSGVSGSGHEPADHYNSSDSAFWWNQFGHGFVWTCMNISYTHGLPLWENHEQPTTIGSWGTFFSDKAICLEKKWRLDHENFKLGLTWV